MDDAVAAFRTVPHAFAAPAASRQYFGHWLEYNAAAAQQATQEVRNFLIEYMRQWRALHAPNPENCVMRERVHTPRRYPEYDNFAGYHED